MYVIAHVTKLVLVGSLDIGELFTPSTDCPANAPHTPWEVQVPNTMSHSHEHSHGHDHHSHEQQHTHSHDGVPCGGHDQPSDGVPLNDPLSDPTELRVLLSALSSFYLYRRTAHLNLTHQRRKDFYKLPLRHRELLSGGNNSGVNYLQALRDVDDAIALNANLCEQIFATGIEAFGAPPPPEGSVTGEEGAPPPWWEVAASAGDVEKVTSTVKQFWRDWSVEGGEERERCYGHVLRELERLFPEAAEPEEGAADTHTSSSSSSSSYRPRKSVKVLVPGAGLGRLPFEVVRRGFWCQGNEVSYHMLAASNWVLNCISAPHPPPPTQPGASTTSQVVPPPSQKMQISPWCHSFSNHVSRADVVRRVEIPDIFPSEILLGSSSSSDGDDAEEEEQEEDYDETSSDIPAARFSMVAGDFTDSYSGPESAGEFDVVATVFFIDTAGDVVEYLERIFYVLKAGGRWINLGPLLWHWEGRRAGGGDAEHQHEHEHSEAHDDSHDDDEEEEEEEDDIEEEEEGSRRGSGSGSGSSAHGHANGSHSGGKVELTVEEVLGLARAVGFRIVKRGIDGEGGRVRTGYVQNERSLLRYEYDAEGCHRENSAYIYILGTYVFAGRYVFFQRIYISYIVHFVGFFFSGHWKYQVTKNRFILKIV
ncbi:N2227-like protein-domain-containing protein [Peziza echinospora]|nr:N2227-like protein-domain-containing protein [Peziza echinospora]